MNTQPNLFDYSVQPDIARVMDTITKTEKTVYEYHIVIDGIKFDAYDMLETVESVEEDSIYIECTNMAKVLLRLGVITSRGNPRWESRATPGPNYKIFRDLLRKKVSEA